MALSKKEIEQFMAIKNGPRATGGIAARREQAVRLQLQGLTLVQIAEQLRVSPQTVNKDLIEMRKQLGTKK